LAELFFGTTASFSLSFFRSVETKMQYKIVKEKKRKENANPELKKYERLYL